MTMGARILLLVALTLLAYLPSMRGEFLWDDEAHLKIDPALQTAHALKMIWITPGFTPQYYPLTHTTFWLEGRLWGANPLGYHLANVLLHAASALLLWRILWMLGVPGAALAAAVFALHPVHVESVAWVTERKNVLSGFFYLLAALSFLANEQRTWGGKEERRGVSPHRLMYALALLSFVASVLSKTVAGTLPAALLLVLWWKRGRISRHQVLSVLPMFVIALVMGRITASMERWNVGATGPEWDYSFFERLLIAGRAVWFYLRTLICPLDLMFIYPKWQIAPWQVIFPLAAVLLVAGLVKFRNRIGRGPLAAVLLFGGTLLPALGFVNIYPMRFSLVADHFQYLASIGIIALAAAALARLKRYGWIVPVVLAALTWQRAHAFADPRSLWEDTLARNDRAWIAHDSLGYMALARQDYEQAAGHFQRSIQIEPNHAEPYIGMGNLYGALNRPQEAIEQMRLAVKVQPDKVQPHYALGATLAAQGDLPGAVEAMEQALRVKSGFIPARLRLADLYTRLGQPEKADEQKREAQRLLREAFGYHAQPVVGSLRNE